MPLAAGFVGILPALGLLEEDRDGVPPLQLSWISAVGWSCAVAFFGYAFTVGLKLSSGLTVLEMQSLPLSSITQASGKPTYLHESKLRMRRFYPRSLKNN